MEDETVKSLASLIKEIKGILKSEISMINDKGYSLKEKEEEPIEEQIRTNNLLTTRSFLELFEKIVGFLYKKLDENSPDEDFFFFLPLIRSLIEIYACLLYFCFQDKNKKMILSISDTLYTLSVCNTGRTEGIIDGYNKNYAYFKDFIIKERLLIPEDINKMSKKLLERNHYNYPPVNQMLKEEWISQSSPQFTSVNKPSVGNHYIIYRHLSNYVHGNILIKEHYGTEKMWVISEILMISTRVAELINIKILDSSKTREIAEHIKNVRKNISDFKELWQNIKPKK